MRGLVNLGNTCYFNTAIQCLAHCPPLTKHLFFNTYEGKCKITQEYTKLCRLLFLANSKDPIDPSGLIEAFRERFPRFRALQQHDSQEVIVSLIDVFEESLGPEFIREIFNGEECQETAWPNGTSTVKIPFTTLILEPVSETTLEDLLEKHTKIRALSDFTDDQGNKYHCAAVRNNVTRWPKIISFTFSMYRRKYSIKIPVTFKGRRFFAAVIHQGSVWGGHYVLLVKRYDKWYIKDDENVTELDGEPSLNAPFYMVWFR